MEAKIMENGNFRLSLIADELSKSLVTAQHIVIGATFSSMKKYINKKKS